MINKKYCAIGLCISFYSIAVKAMHIIPRSGDIIVYDDALVAKYWPLAKEQKLNDNLNPQPTHWDAYTLKYVALGFVHDQYFKWKNEDNGFKYSAKGMAQLNFQLKGEKLNVPLTLGYMNQKGITISKESIIDSWENDIYKAYSTPLGGLYVVHKSADNAIGAIQKPIELETSIQEVYTQSSSADEYIDKIDNLLDAHTYFKLSPLGGKANNLLAAATKTHIDIWASFKDKVHTIPLQLSAPIQSICINAANTLAYLQSDTKKTRLYWKDTCVDCVYSDTKLQEIIYKDMTHHTPLHNDGTTISFDALFLTHTEIYTYSVPQSYIIDPSSPQEGSDIVAYLAHHTQKNMKPWEQYIKILWLHILSNTPMDTKIDNVWKLIEKPKETLVASYLIQKYMLTRFGFNKNNIGFSLRSIWDRGVINATHRLYGSVDRGPYVVAFANGHTDFYTILPDSAVKDKPIISDELIEESIEKGNTEPITKDIEDKFDALNIIINPSENSYIKSTKLQNGTIAVEKYSIEKNGNEKSQNWEGGTTIESDFKACAFGKKDTSVLCSTGIDLLCQENRPEPGQQPKQRFMRGYTAIDLPKPCEPNIYYDKNDKPYLYLQKKGLLNHIAPLIYWFESKKKNGYTNIKLRTKRESLGWSLVNLVNPLAWIRGIGSYFVN